MTDITRLSSEELHLELFMKEEFNGCIDPVLNDYSAEDIHKELVRRGFYRK